MARESCSSFLIAITYSYRREFLGVRVRGGAGPPAQGEGAWLTLPVYRRDKERLPASPIGAICDSVTAEGEKGRGFGESHGRRDKDALKLLRGKGLERRISEEGARWKLTQRMFGGGAENLLRGGYLE